jgi:hypothetical protein
MPTALKPTRRIWLRGRGPRRGRSWRRARRSERVRLGGRVSRGRLVEFVPGLSFERFLAEDLRCVGDMQAKFKASELRR